MITPAVDKLTQNGKYNRYTLCIAASKCARKVTEEYLVEIKKEYAPSDKEQIKKRSELRDEKPLKIALNRIIDGKYEINDESIDLSDR